MKKNKNYWAGRSGSAGLSRRTFLKASALAAGAATFSGPLILHAADAGNKLNVALIGCGTRGGQIKGGANNGMATLIAHCDVDESKLPGGGNTYTDYRKMLDKEKSLDAVLIATCDHWHAPLCKAFMQAGKHVYCEKPLTRTLAEAIELQQLVKTCKVATQMGNQGSGSSSARRAVEVIQAGAIGQVHEVHAQHGGGGFPHDMAIPQDADPIPASLNWDMWCGGSPVHPYKGKIYHPYQWRGWFDYGTGQLGNFGTHSMTITTHALKLATADKIELLSPPGGKDSQSKNNAIRYYFPAREGMDAVTVSWYDTDAKVPAEVQAISKEAVVIIGEKGVIISDPWNNGAKIQLKGEAGFTDINKHDATASIPKTVPRVRGHMDEWLEACRSGAQPYSNFGFGHGAIIAAGVLTLRVGKTIEFNSGTWDLKNMPDVEQYKNPEYRKEYKVMGA